MNGEKKEKKSEVPSGSEISISADATVLFVGEKGWHPRRINPIITQCAIYAIFDFGRLLRLNASQLSPF